MRKAKCVVCTRVHEYSRDRAYYLDRTGPYICSPQCLLEWKEYSGKNFCLETYVDSLEIGRFTFGIIHPVSSLQVEFRSAYEKRVAVFFLKNRIKFYYECFTFKWGRRREYTPDFYLPNHNCFIEVKGNWASGTRKKYKEFREVFPRVPLLVSHWHLYRMFPSAKQFEKGCK